MYRGFLFVDIKLMKAEGDFKKEVTRVRLKKKYYCTLDKKYSHNTSDTDTYVIELLHLLSSFSGINLYYF